MRGTTLLAMLFCCRVISAQDWKNVGNCGAGLECGPQCQRLCLIQHNYYRSLHNSPPLKCDPHLADSAQFWADFVAGQGALQRSTPTDDYAESISWKSWGWKGMETKLGAIPGAVRSWYSELKRGYDYNTGKGDVTHFKSVVDAREARLGCGITIRPGDGTYVVAHYSLPPGEKFKLNDFIPSTDVQIRQQPDPRCHLKSFEREQCGDLKSPLITPDKCIKAGCCYDDMFMDEPSLQWHSQNASIWCFKMKNILSNVPGPIDVQKPEPGPILALPNLLPAQLSKENPAENLKTAQISTTQDWEDVGSCGAGLTCGPDCQLLCLKMHNYYRSLHNSPPMKCDPELAKSAQKWTDQQAADGKMYHSEWTDKFTESISWKGWGWEGMDKMEGAIPGAVRSWYSEIKNGYNYESGTGTGVIGHFQAVVWKDEGKLGCGLNFKVGDGTYVTAHYAPPSHTSMNKEELAKSQVKPRKQPELIEELLVTNFHLTNAVRQFVLSFDLLTLLTYSEPECDIHSSQRVDCFGEATESTPLEQKVPYVTPEVCQQKGCCYDDMYMNEEETWFYKPPGRTWCFKKKGGAPGEEPAQQPSQQPPSPTTQPPTSGPTAMPGGSPPQPPISQPSGGTGDKCLANSCYKFVETGKTWDENQGSCKAEGGNLVSMESEAEWKYINGEMQQITLPGVNEWHIGLKKQGTWQWVSGKPLTIKKWQMHEPSGDGNVAVMSKDYPPGSQGLFNDLKGIYTKPFICEMPSGVKPPAPPETTAAPLGSTTLPPGATTIPQGSTVSPSRTPPTSAAGGGEGGGGGETQGMTGFEKDCLKAHNEYRAKHGVPPLKWNAQLKADAQKWANHLADINQMVHDYESINKGSGENLAYFQPGDPNNMPTQCQGPKNPSCVQCREMVADWYSEESNFDYNTGESKGGVILHFTQVVWKETTELGMATATSEDSWFSVARYKKRGNMGYPKDYIENVPRPQ